MPLIIEGGRVPSRWAERRASSSVIPIDSRVRRPDGISLALINNMPDPALEDTELQFFELLDIASGDVPVYIKLYSLTGVPRTDRGQRHLNSFYFDFDDLWKSRFDGVIITGTEPHCSNLRDEPYWALLAEVFEWAERNTSSTILSCLAAHASVLHCDGIKRHPLPDKKFGVFESTRNSDHPLISQAGDIVRFPHSRWNEVREDELTAAGYVVLTKSEEAGVDLFVKKKRGSLFVHFQGHPEYSAQTLAKEYRRDIKRFLRGERETFPTMPHGYFDEAASRLLNEFREKAIADRSDELMASFPETVVEAPRSSWHASAMGVYGNWLQFLSTVNSEAAAFSAMPSLHALPRRKQSAVS
jgi:homoserine O-succinyltransferase/O-acetyltransferase